MAKTLWDINFSTLNVTNDAAYQGWDTKYTHSDNLTNGVYKADGQGSTPSFALNAIDIDWNGAQINSVANSNNKTTINNTGGLLKYLQDLLSRINSINQDHGNTLGSLLSTTSSQTTQISTLTLNDSNQNTAIGNINSQIENFNSQIENLINRVNYLESLHGGSGPVTGPIDPTIIIPMPSTTTIADGQSITMTGTSNVPGTLTLSPSAGTGWNTTVTSLNGQTTHKIQITNIAASKSGTATNYESSSIAAGYIKGTFKPNDTTSYNTLSEIAINTGSINISPYVYPTGVTIEGSTQITNGSTGTITVNVLPSNATNKVIRLDANSGIAFGTTGNTTTTNVNSGHTIVVRGTSTGYSSIIATVTGPVGSSQLIQAITGTHQVEITSAPVTYYTATLQITNGTTTSTVSQQVAQGSKATWTVSANTGYNLPTSVTNGTISGSIVTSNTVNSNITVTVNCIIKTFTVTLQITNGTTSSTNPQNINYGSKATWIVSPNTGYNLPTSVTNGTISGSTITSNTITANTTIKVNCIASTTYYFSVGTTVPTASNYTTVNGATTTIPTTKEFTNNSGSRTYAYILVPSNKTVSVIEKTLGGTVSVSEYTDVSITNHKVYKTGSAVANGGTIVITLS